MRALAAIVLAGGLCACGTAIESADEDNVSIRYNNYAQSPITLRAMAEEHCASYDRVAVYRGTSLGEGLTGFLAASPTYAEFECHAEGPFGVPADGIGRGPWTFDVDG